LNSKRTDGDSVKETSPLSKFLGICTTIQGHDLFAIPINKTIGTPAFHQAFSLQTFANLSLLLPPPAQLQEPMEGSGNRHRTTDEAEGSRAGARRRQ
jgi:hypothetical protein